jgi:RNA polymerase sigma-70 factor, ECF subfamily
MTEQAIKVLINTLPSIYQEVLLLYEFDELSIREIAEKLSISISSAKARLHRGRKMLREKLKEFCTFELDSFGLIIDYALTEKAYDHLKKMENI